MRPAHVLALALLLAGCTVPSTPPPGAAPSSWVLDCTPDARAEQAWPHPCAVQASGSEGPKQEIWLGVNPTAAGNVVLAAKDNDPAKSRDCVWSGLFVTHDGGATWTDSALGGLLAERQPGDPGFGYACASDPMFTFGPEGNLYYLQEMYNLGADSAFGPLGPGPESGRMLWASSFRIELWTSEDGGASWARSVPWLLGDGLTTFQDYSRITVNPATGTVLGMINTFDGSTFTTGGLGSPGGPGHDWCNVMSSRDEGRSADPVVIVTAPEGPAPGMFCATIEAAADGTVTMLLLSGGQERTVHATRSTDDGRTWSPVAPAFDYVAMPVAGAPFEENRFRTGVEIDIAYDRTDGPHAGRLYAIMGTHPGEDADVVVRWSDDHGGTWSGPVRLHEESGSFDQWLGNVVVAGDGSVHAVHATKEFDPGNKLVDIVHTWSLDGGATWRRERVTAQSYDGDLGVHQERFPFFGDYLGIDSAGPEVWMGFPESTNGATTVAAAARVVRT